MLLLWLNFLAFPFPDKDVIRNGIPGIVNANEEQQQRRRGHEEQRWTLMRMSHVGRYNQRRVHCKWKQNMEQPILKYGLVSDLYRQTPSHDDDVQ